MDRGGVRERSDAYGWYVVGLLMVVYVFSFLDRQILSMMVGDLKRGLDLEHDWQVAVLMGPAFAVFYVICGIPFGRLADTRSRKHIIAYGLAAWSLLTVGCGIARNFAQMLLLRVGVGVGEASLSPSAYSIISDYFDQTKLARAIALYSSGIYLGSGLAYMIGGRAITALRGTEPWAFPLLGAIEGWQKVFWIVGLPGLAVAPFVLWTLREPARRGLVDDSSDGAPVALPLTEVLRHVRANGVALATHNIGFALLSFSSYGSGAWLPAMFERVHGWDAASFGLVYGLIVFVGSAGGAIIGGIVADRLAERGHRDAKVRVGWMAAWLWFPFGIAFPLVEDGVLAMALVAPAAFFASMPFGVAPAALQEMMPNELRGQISAIYLFVINLIGLAIGPLVLALVTDYVFDASSHGVAGIRWSLLSTTCLAHLLATLILWRGMSAYRESLDRLQALRA
ncbi:MAG: MFS transporter [Deltaproteobacteria bacterium]|jgi:MFS family permease|nr:MFS transporter [Deltaproteobacteria bacterium]MBW2496734.1 MFS transporter [Deltaproteobacteria bacterium]